MKFVIDASVVVDFLLQRQPFYRKITLALENATFLAAPHLLDIEVTQVIRRFNLRGELSSFHANAILSDLADLPCQRYPHDALLKRVFQLRHNLTAYDASYLALAEGLNATLLTKDKGFLALPERSVFIQHISADN